MPSIPMQTVYAQPSTPETMKIHSYDEKQYTHQNCLGQCPQADFATSPETHRCSHSHYRSATHVHPLVIIALVVFFTVLVLFTACVSYSFLFGDIGRDIFGSGVEGMVRRAAGDPNGNDGTFVHNKLYLIVIFVGLLVVVILAIMLSAWCCRGAFQNPLCCPCYLCACCGGLACLECIGCGLCAEGLDQV